MTESLAEFEDRVLQAIVAGVCMVRCSDGTIAYANHRCARILGFTPSELCGRTLESVGCLTPSTAGAEVEVRRKDGASIWCRTSSERLDHPVHGPVHVTVLEDVTERRQTEERLRASVAEKEVLLREIHHRVKNNLQIVSSLLNVQARSCTDPAVRSMFKDNQSRVRALALIHERLYRSENLARVDMSEYLDSLMHNLVRAIGAPGQSVSVALDVDRVELGVDTAIPVGLIVNELVSNSLRHAFPEGRQGAIRVQLRWTGEGRLELTQSDDGIGMPKALDPFASRSMGLELVRTLVRQLGGGSAWRRGRGTEVVIEFPEAS